MTPANKEFFHQIYGRKKTRILYRKEDFIDYALMTAITGVVIYLCFGSAHIITQISLVLLGLMLIAFPVRHGFALRTPVILSRPQEMLYMIVYKMRNFRAPLLFAMAFLVL